MTKKSDEKEKSTKRKGKTGVRPCLLMEELFAVVVEIVVVVVVVLLLEPRRVGAALEVFDAEFESGL